MTTTRSSIAGLAIVGLFVLGACGSDDNSSSDATTAPAASAAPTGSAAAGAAVTGSIDVADQSSDGKTITVDAVNITGAAGFIAVHADADGAPGPVVGHAAIPEGDSSKVVITLDAPVTTGAFWPMLHLDAGTIGTYEFPGPDGPVKSGADIVMKKITLTVS
jgi:hypothetical protein